MTEPIKEAPTPDPHPPAKEMSKKEFEELYGFIDEKNKSKYWMVARKWPYWVAGGLLAGLGFSFNWAKSYVQEEIPQKITTAVDKKIDHVAESEVIQRAEQRAEQVSQAAALAIEDAKTASDAVLEGSKVAADAAALWLAQAQEAKKAGAEIKQLKDELELLRKQASALRSQVGGLETLAARSQLDVRPLTIQDSEYLEIHVSHGQTITLKAEIEFYGVGGQEYREGLLSVSSGIVQIGRGATEKYRDEKRRDKTRIVPPKEPESLPAGTYKLLDEEGHTRLYLRAKTPVPVTAFVMG